MNLFLRLARSSLQLVLITFVSLNSYQAWSADDPDFDLWGPAAARGEAWAQYDLGVAYGKGDGVIQDDKLAAKWFRLAAEQGYSLAQYNLGVHYANGEGVIQDHKEAAKWYRLAAEQGDSLAQYNLGVLYNGGEGVIQDLIYAHMWVNIAASNGAEPASESRSKLSELMTPADISKAQQLARECVKKEYKGC